MFITKIKRKLIKKAKKVSRKRKSLRAIKILSKILLHKLNRQVTNVAN